MIELSFPDGSKKQYNAGVTGLEIATDISPQLAKAALAVKVDDDVEDLSRPIEKDAKISILTWDDPEGKHTFWHTSAHLMAEAVQELFPRYTVRHWSGYRKRLLLRCYSSRRHSYSRKRLCQNRRENAGAA